MKIGFDAKRAFLNQAGLGNYSRNILNSLKEFFPETDYILYTPKIRKDLFPAYNDFKVYSPDNSFLKIFSSLWRSFLLTPQLISHKIELFHGLTHELPSGIDKTSVKCVVTIHDLIFLRFQQFYKPIDREIYLRKIKYACEAADLIIAISQQTKDDIISFLGVSPDKIKVVYQGISARFYSSTDEIKLKNVKAKYNLPQKYILSLGTIECRKNQLNIFKALVSANIDIPLVLVGRSTSYATKITEFISNNNLDEKVILLDNVPDEDLPELYKSASMLVYISLFEGFGLPIIESMASGCPVITSNVSCMPEIGGDAAVLCDPDDIEMIANSIKNILEDSDFRDSLIKKGKLRAQEFTPEKTAKDIYKVYKEILKDG